MTGSRARSLTVTLVLIAACAQRSGGSGANKLDQTQQAESGGIAPVACPPSPSNPFTTDPYDQCSLVSAPAGTQAVSAEFVTVGYDSLLPLGNEVVNEVAQTFQVKTPDGALPGSIGLTLKLLTNTSIDSATNVLIVDLIGPLNDPTTGAPEVVPPSGANGANDPSDLQNFQPLLAEGRYDTSALQYDVDTPVQINFQFSTSTPNVSMQVGKTYAFVFYMQAPSLNRIGIAANADSQKWYCTVDPATGTVDHVTTPGPLDGTCAAPSTPIGYAWTRQERMESTDTPTNPAWVQDAIEDLNFYTTVNDGCSAGASRACGKGICTRLTPACDAFGNFTPCFPDSCTTSADCVLNPGSPTPILSGAACINNSGLVNAGSCEPLTETCDGYDDDCNGLTDEGLGYTPCGVGGCATSVYNCVMQTGNTAGCAYDQGSNQYSCIQNATYGVPAVCSQYEAAPSAEVCNGIDDNCNGITDEGLTDTVACGFGLCQRVAYSCTLEPGASGTQACASGTPGGGEPYYCIDESTQYGEQVGPAPDTFQCTPDFTKQTAETCNDVDDDCDGYTDNAQTGVAPTAPGNTGKVSQYYYPTGILGQPATPTTISPAPPNTFKGNCRFGVEYCNSTTPGVASWDPATAPAIAAVTPIAEAPGNGLSDPLADYLCNGQDDDCDGYTDNWPQNQPLPMNRDYWPNGVSGEHIGQCQDGLETCDDWFNPPGNAASGTYTPYPGDPYTADSRDPQHPEWAISTNPILPSGEICNGLDDNCNGQTDEGLGSSICGNGVCATTVANCEYVSQGADAGYVTLVSCKSGGFTNLGNTSAASPEICNGLDDDCDGVTDNFAGTPTNYDLTEQCHTLCTAYNTLHGAQICQYPNGNAQGACRAGTLACDGASGWNATCGSGGEAELGPSTEICNGSDDDCDGYTDNIALSGVNGGITENCGTGVGQCRAGTATCLTPYNYTPGANNWSACGGTYIGPTTELCNNKDDDCDGYTDNATTGNPALLTANCDPACVAWNSTGQGHTLGDTCTPGVGRCSYGTETCDSAASNSSPTYNSCGVGVGATAETPPSTELCNGFDDDCDGYTDNNPGQGNYSLTNTGYDSKCGATYGTPDCVEGRGQCSGGAEKCGAGGWVPNTPGDDTGPTAELCNNKDDDCDGYTDNQTTGSPALLTTQCDTLCQAWNNTGQGHTLGDTCTPGVGQCSYGTATCDSAASNSTPYYNACGSGVAEQGPTAELCNNKDDDCDGYTDNKPGLGNNTLQQSLDPLCAADEYCKRNTGQCKDNVQTCEAVETWTTITGYDSEDGRTDDAEIGPTAEVCNDLDDDCDGYTDNAASGSPAALKQSCNAGGICGSGVTCTPGMAIESPATDCSPGTCEYEPNGVPVGICASSAGAQSCSAGMWGSCTGGTSPSKESCDGLDDDCDGYTDNWVTYATGCSTTGACMCPITDGSTNPTAQCSATGMTQIGVNPSTSAGATDTCLNVANGCRVVEGSNLDGQSTGGGGCSANYYDFDGNFCNGCEAYDRTAVNGYTGAESSTCVAGYTIPGSPIAANGGSTSLQVTGTIVSQTSFTSSTGTSLNGHNYYQLTVNPATWSTSAANNPCGSSETGYGAGNTCTITNNNFGTLHIGIAGANNEGGTYVFRVYSSSCAGDVGANPLTGTGYTNSSTAWVNNATTDSTYNNAGGGPTAVAAGSSTCSSGGWVTSFDLADNQSSGAFPYQTRNGATTSPDGWTPSGASGVQTIYLDVFRIGGTSTDNSATGTQGTTGDIYTLTVTH